MGRPITIDHEKVDSYVRINHEYEMVGEMAKFLKVGYLIIVKSLDKQGLRSRKKQDRIIEYLRENEGKKTIAKMAKTLDVTEATLYIICEKHGFKWLDPWENKATEIQQKEDSLRRRKDIIDYLRDNREKKTVEEFAAELSISERNIYKICKENGIEAHTAKDGDIDYWPPFEKMDQRWHDALWRVAAAVFGEDGRKQDEGCEEWEARKARQKSIRPPAVYDVKIQSPIIKEYLNEQGYHVRE
jgi:hypothetical protein